MSQYKREISLPVQYENLLQSVDSYPLMNESNEDTLWQTMVYDQHYGKEIFEGLKQIYVLLRSGEIKRSWITSMSTVSIIVPSATPSPSEYVLLTTTTTITIIFMSRRRMPPDLRT